MGQGDMVDFQLIECAPLMSLFDNLLEFVVTLSCGVNLIMNEGICSTFVHE
jgi:hypothetical protein